MEIRKEEEVAHYDRLAREWQGHPALSVDIEKTDVMKMASYQKLYELLRQYVPGKKVLDYGCGHGMHTIELARMGTKEVVGIDLSEESLKIAEERIQLLDPRSQILFKRMDAEALEFSNNSFDIVFDGGTFSSIELTKGLREIHRVLKPGGLLIGIETLGHHPLANLKRWLNKKRVIRTTWAASHIMKMSDFEIAKKHFRLEQVHFFHFISLLTIPFLHLPSSVPLMEPSGILLDKITSGVDRLLFKIFPFLKKYAFKAVFVFKKASEKRGTPERPSRVMRD